jgi:hypothetical protein
MSCPDYSVSALTKSFSNYSTSESSTGIPLEESTEFIKTLNEYVIIYKQDWKKVVIRMGVLYLKKFTVAKLKEIYKRECGKIGRTRFSQKLDDELIQKIKVHGLNWRKISEEVPKLKPLCIRNRYYSTLRFSFKVLKKNTEPGQAKKTARKNNLADSSLFMETESFQESYPEETLESTKFKFNEEIDLNLLVKDI